MESFCRQEYEEVIIELKMAVQQPRGTKRSYDQLIGVMDLYYKQENDALLVQNRGLMADNKKHKKTVTVLRRLHAWQEDHIARLNQEATTRQNMLNLIFETFPEVTDLFVNLETEEEVMSDTESDGQDEWNMMFDEIVE